MKLVKIKHYVESSFEGKPSFVLEMSDGKEYISNGCVWKENTQANIDDLINQHDCKADLDELFASKSIEMGEVTDAHGMFSHSQLTKFSSKMPKVTYAYEMFAHSKITEFSSNMPNVTDVSWMFKDCPYGEKK